MLNGQESGVGGSAIAILSASPSRTVLADLTAHRRVGEASVTLEELAQRLRPRLSTRSARKTLAVLERAGVVERHASGDPARPARTEWTLREHGVDLQHLSELMVRIVTTTLGDVTSVDARDQEAMTCRVLAALNDPTTVRVLRTVAIGPRFAGELEVACAAVTARRSLYRRLTRLVRAGVLERHATHEVPRRIAYELTPRARPLALLFVLAAWWEVRHGGPNEELLAFDLDSVIHAVAPLVHPSPVLEGAQVGWVVDGGASRSALALTVVGGRLEVARIPSARPASFEDARVHAPPDAWCAALIERDLSGLRTSGDSVVARRIGQEIRQVLLAPLRT
jgi:DNA-binding HxlR family transcriptional regulator